MTQAERTAQRFKEIYREKIKRPGAADLLAWLETKTDFFTAPASTKYHGAYEGGLVDHSLNVYAALTNKAGINEDTDSTMGHRHESIKFI